MVEGSTGFAGTGGGADARATPKDAKRPGESQSKCRPWATRLTSQPEMRASLTSRPDLSASVATSSRIFVKVS